MARPKSQGETKTHQQHLLMAPSEIAAIDDWSFANRIRSRGEAIRRLCQMGLAFDAAREDVQGRLAPLEQDLARLMGAYDKVEDADVSGEFLQALDAVMGRLLGALESAGLLDEVSEEFKDGRLPIEHAEKWAGRTMARPRKMP